MARNAFISWWKMFVRLESVFENAPDDCAGKALKASFLYARTGEVPELDPVSLILFSAIRPSIDDSAETFENISKRNRENIKKRWADGKESLPIKPDDTKTYQSIPDVPEKTEDRSKKKEVRSEKIEDRESKADKPPRAHFQPPTEAESIAYFAEQGSSEQEAKSFIDYYTAKGWKIGEKAQMKNWKAAARNWIRRSAEYGRSKATEKKAQTTTRVSITDGFV